MTKMSIRSRLLVLPILTLLVIISAGQIISNRIFIRQFTAETLSSQNREIALIHEFINIAQKKALENYLKGIAEDVRFSVGTIHRARLNGVITEEQALRNLTASLSGRRIGESGYIYVIDSTGTIRHHPHVELIDLSIEQYEFIQTQTVLKNGYLEYEWANPDDLSPREKALYMVYYQPLDWIITVSAYRSEFSDLVSVTDLRAFVSEFTDEDDSTYILDEAGRYLVHPHAEGRLISEDGDRRGLAREILSGRSSGELTFDVGDGRSPNRHFHTARYSHLPDFGWYVVSEFDVGEEYGAVRSGTSATAVVGLVSLLITAALLYFIGLSISRPIAKLHRLVAEGQSGTEISGPKSDEITRLTKAFLRYRVDLDTERKALSRIAHFVNISPMPILRIGDDWLCTFTNVAAAGTVADAVLDGENRIAETWREALRNCISGSRPVPLTINGREYLISCSGSDAGGESYLALMDITDSTRYETLLSIWHSVFDHSIEGILITDENGNVERVNDSFTRITGYTEDEIIGQNTRLLKSGVHDAAFYTQMWDSLTRDGYWADEIWNRRKNGEIFPEWLSVSAFEDSASHHRKYMAIFHDITRLKNQERLINRMELIDRLTELPNRENFYAALDRRATGYLTESRGFAVAILDLDGFSLLNESYGVPTGDNVLQLVASGLKDSLRADDHLARIGGDEFGIVLTGLENDDSHITAMNRVMKVFERDFEVLGRRIRLSAYAGVHMVDKKHSDADTLLANAQAALRRAKAYAQGDYVLFDDNRETGTVERLEMEIALREALHKKELYLEYQPIVNADTGGISCFEALLRWRHGDRLIGPDRFITIAEATGLIVPIGRWIISEACRAVSQFPEDDLPKIAVNISARQFSDPGFQNDLISTVERLGVPPRCIGLEITENIAAANVQGTISLLQDISSVGFPISIDDFGTGYSSLKYITDFAFDILKIDKSFVAGLPDNKDSLAVIRAIISMGHSLDKRIVAEGVENEAQFAVLQQLGCEQIQGYYFSRPLGISDAVAFWTEARSSARDEDPEPLPV